MPQVSVIIPAFNSGRFLDEAIASVVAQSFTDWECIVVDDGSTEDLTRVERADSRVRLVRQENRGVAMARNRGIAESAGELIAFLDHDDVFLSTKLENQVKAMMADPTVGLCHTHFRIVDEHGACSDHEPVMPGNDFLTMLRYGAPFPTNTMVRRSVLQLTGLFDPFLTPSEDQDLFIRIAKFSKVAYLPTCEGLYRVHGRNTSKNYMACLRTLNNLSQRHQLFAESHDDPAAKSAAVEMMEYRRKCVFGPQAYDSARLAMREGNAIAFAVHLARALWWSPKFTLPALVMYLVSPRRERKSAGTGL